MSLFGDPPPIIPSPAPMNKGTRKHPQATLVDFWSKFTSKDPGKVTSIFPRSLYSAAAAPHHPRGLKSARNAAESYEAAARECRERVNRIVRECRRTNEKFTDPDFDIEHDEYDNCLNGLVRPDSSAPPAGAAAAPNVSSWELRNSLQVLAQSQMLGQDGRVPVDVGALGRFIGDDGGMNGQGVGAGFLDRPGSVHRVDWIFSSPRFTVDGFSSSDIKQGANGDCWWLAAVATIAHRRDLMDSICVKRDEECGVYGFVFHRDGEWVPCVIDDNLYLQETDFDFYGDVYDSTRKRANKYRKEKQTGSDALYFGRCEDQNETWLPLLEKAYAKAHGDYAAIDGGWPGQAVEDMTGGVTTTIATNRVLSKDKLWGELAHSDGEFVFSLAAMGTGWDNFRGGLALGHAYSILEVREELTEDGREKKRLIKIRNPWGGRDGYGLGEWNGPWSDGSREWTPYWLKKIGHTFGDDGVFWMEFSDMLETFMFLHRTRLFDERWTVVQQWTSTNVSWVTSYLQAKFEIEVKKGGVVIIVLTQLDERYFQGLEGEYYFELHFVLQQAGSQAGDHICRVRPVHKWENRSVSCEVELEPGTYEVLPKIAATRSERARPVEEVVKEYADKNPQKLRQVGMQYDIAHAKGGILNEEEALEKKKLDDKKKREEKKKKQRDRLRKARARPARTAQVEVAAIGDGEEGDGGKTDENKAEVEAGGDAKPSETGSSEPKEATADEPTAAGPEDEPQKSTDEVAQQAEAPKDIPVAATAEPASSSTDSTAPKEEKVEEATTAAAVENMPEEEKEDDDDEESNSEGESENEDEDEGGQGAKSPWNAVCVLGLRVYARDPEVSVKLVKPEEKDEKTSLTVEGQPAGATM